MENDVMAALAAKLGLTAWPVMLTLEATKPTPADPLAQREKLTLVWADGSSDCVVISGTTSNQILLSVGSALRQQQRKV